jgi:chitodextrinase
MLSTVAVAASVLVVSPAEASLAGTEAASSTTASVRMAPDPAPASGTEEPPFVDGAPTTDDPPTYARYPAVADPGSGAATYFSPLWYDTAGRHIQAHGGQLVAVSAEELGVDASDIVTAEEDGQTVYFWYGEDRSRGYYGSPGVAVYRSTDTYNWTFESIALRSVSSASDLTRPYFDALYDTVREDGQPDAERIAQLDYYLNTTQSAEYTAIFERPKVLYNEKNGTWVMWWHADGRTTPGGSTYARSLAAVAVSESPAGPFRLTGAYRMYNRENYRQCISAAVPGQARDMTVFKDVDGTAYIVYSSEENRSLYVARLNEDYTNVEHTTTEDAIGIQYSESGEYPYLFADGTPEAPVRGEDFQIVKECGMLEAPALFTHGGKYYVIASGATGWAPNPQTYHTADEILGSWIRGVEPDDRYENVAYNAIPEGGDGLLSIGDARRSSFGSQSTNVLTLAPGKYVYMGDRWNSGAADSTYVWLPITVGENGRLEMRNPAAEDPQRWGEGWDAAYWDDKGAGAEIWTVVDDHLPSTVRRGSDVLPETVDVRAGGITSATGVTWDVADLDQLGTHVVTGTLAAGDGFGPGRTITRELTVWDYGQVNVAPSATVTASSRNNLARNVVDGNTKAKGWDDWVSGGNHPQDSTLSFTWAAPQEVDAVVVHTFNDGGATWPSTISVQYQDAAGAWVTSTVSASVDQSSAAAPPVVSLDVSELPATKGIRLQLVTATNTWQSISEVEIWGGPGPANLCRAGGVSASFHQTAYETMPASFACDGSSSTAWSTWTTGGAWQDEVTYTVAASTAYRVDQLSFTNIEGNLTGVSVDYRGTDGAWHPTSAQDVAPAANRTATTIGFDPVVATSLRLTFSTPGSYLKIPELMIPGVLVAAPQSLSVTGAGKVVAGESLELAAVAAPDGADATVRWTSSDESVATVSADGVVTGVSFGEAKIRATAVTDPSVSSTVTVSVLPEPWSARATYDDGDLVSYQGAAYEAQWWTTNQKPGDPWGPWMEYGALVETADGTYRTWTASWVYSGGETVVHDGHLWKAKWWTRNKAPGDPRGPWQDLGDV